ncbi:MAG: polysaccharide biosynthesis C-terminal domain-containing protein, partial [Clostridia bacterium]|nr:polysaccharide biosynthesis C-terminal domain-containing protein [Clostridia bacterium]
HRMFPILSMTAGCAVKLISGYFLIGELGMTGTPISTGLCYGVTSVLNLWYIYVKIGRAMETWIVFFKPMICGSLSAAAGYFAYGYHTLKGRCREISKDGDLYTLTVKLADSEETISAKALVGADGGGSVVRKIFFTPMKIQYVAIQQWFENKGQKLPYYSCIFDAKTSDSCSWTIHKGNYVIFGGAFERQGCRSAFDLQKSRLEKFLGNSFGEVLKTEACLVSSPRAMKDFCTGKENIFLLGEAAGFISASSFEGLSSAMLSGKLLADAFAQHVSYPEIQKTYLKTTRSLRLKLRAKSVKRTLLCSPFTRQLIMKSKLQSIEPYRKK